MATTEISYRELWARMVSEKKVMDDFKALELDPTEKGRTKIFEEQTGALPEYPTSFKVGIVGAGCAGLFTGMIIDFINEHVTGLRIQYEILEAASKDRLGGRLYTYNFPVKADSPKGRHDYYDVGAMRFPKIPIMDRTFALFKKVDLEEELIKYYLKDELGVCPSYFNNVRQVGTPLGSDPYELNKTTPKYAQVPDDLMRCGPDKVISSALAKFKEALKQDIESGKDDGWKDVLMVADFMSTRQYLCSSPDAKPIAGLGYSYNTVQWLETFEYGTGWYDQSLAETVLESMDFDYPKAKIEDEKSKASKEGKASGEEEKAIGEEGKASNEEGKATGEEGKASEQDGKASEQDGKASDEVEWRCIEGGTQQVAAAMAAQLSTKPKFGKVVTGIATDEKKTMLVSVKGEVQPRKYFAVFNSTTLGALQQMDLKGANLTYPTKQAIRSLGYGASCKIGIKFSHHWWMEKPFDIKQGGMARTDLPLRVCVYPSYNLKDPVHEPAVLLCSYTWAQDAQRIASLITPESPKGEDDLRKLMFHNLALLHSPTKADYQDTYDTIEQSYLDHYAFDWYNDPLMSGAFAYFGPGQFSQMWPEIITPTGWLYLIGEAASTHHAWIVGALESAVRAVFQMLTALYEQANLKPAEVPERELYRKAMDLLKDEKNAPFGPLPLGVKEDVVIKQAALGFAQEEDEERKKKVKMNGE